VAVGVLLVLANAAQADFMPAVTFSSANAAPIGPSGDQTDGFKFTTNRAITIDALAAYFSSTSGNINVRLYNSSQVVFASTTILTTDPGIATPNPGITLRSHNITPVKLPAGQSFFVAADLVQGDVVQFNATAIMSNPAITYNGGVSGFPTGQKPITDAAGFGSHGYFGPNFAIAPEPSTLALFAVGGASLVGWRWWRKKRAAV